MEKCFKEMFLLYRRCPHCIFLKNEKNMNKNYCKKCTKLFHLKQKQKVLKKVKILKNEYICHKCNEIKPITDFAKHNGKVRGVADYCNICHKLDITVLRWKIKLKMGGKCVLCEYNNILFLQFDHLYDKNIDVSQLRSKQKIIEEAKKCQLLCPNCHFSKSKDCSVSQIKNKSLLSKQAIISRKSRDRNRIYVNNAKIKIGCCAICDLKVENHNFSIFHFDHLIKDKFREVSVLSKCGYSLIMIQKEIEKCRLLCANCHYHHTAIQLNWFKISSIENIFDIEEINDFVNDYEISNFVDFQK